MITHKPRLGQVVVSFACVFVFLAVWSWESCTAELHKASQWAKAWVTEETITFWSRSWFPLFKNCKIGHWPWRTVCSSAYFHIMAYSELNYMWRSLKNVLIVIISNIPPSPVHKILWENNNFHRLYINDGWFEKWCQDRSSSTCIISNGQQRESPKQFKENDLISLLLYDLSC